MFRLENATAKLSNVNSKPELHGEDHVLATYLKVELKASNTILDLFDKNLMPSLFQKAAGEAQETLIDGHLPELRFPLMAAFGYGWEGIGYKVTVEHGISGDDIYMPSSKIDSFVFEPQEGGTVLIRFRIVAHPDALGVGRLSEKQQQEIKLTLEPPTPEEVYQQELNKHKNKDDE